MPVPLDEGERIDAARDRRDAIKAWSFILLLLALTLGALRLFWRGYSWLLFSQSTVVFIGALLYIILFIILPPGFNIKLMMQMQEAGRPLWLIRLVNQWNNVAVFGCAVVLAIYTSPPANMLRRWGANQYDSGFVVITWILLALLLFVGGKGGKSGKSGGGAATGPPGKPGRASKKKKR